MGKYSPNIIANCLISLKKHNPGGEAVVYGERRVTWGALAGRALKLARAMQKLGVKKNDKVTFMFHNCPEFVELNYAIQVAGAVPVPMNYRFIPREIEFQAQHSDSTLFIYESIWREQVEKAAPNLTGIRNYVCRGEGGISGAIEYEEFVSSGEESDPAVATEWEDAAVMVYTGGTTGFPKGVLLSYGAHLDMFAILLANVIVRGVQIELSPEQLENIKDAISIPGLRYVQPLLRTKLMKGFVARPGVKKKAQSFLRYVLSHPEAARFGYANTIKYMVPSMPFFHDASYQILLMGIMVGNICYVLVPGVKFEPAAILEIVQREQPIFMANVPTGWKKLVSYPGLKEYDVSSLKIAATGAGAASVALKRKMFETFPGVLVLDMFGQTEMTPVTSFRIDAGPDSLKERSVGQSIVEVKIVDENGAEVPPGQAGEIMYKSSTVMMGYYKDEGKTSEAMEGGWFKSGDLGYLDEEGEVRLIDRKNECINTGGEKVFPLEVEEIVHQHPQVDDVCIIGVPDDEWGCTVRAVVQLKRGQKANPEDIIEFCRDKLAGFKIPRSVVLVDELPLSPVGKVLRQKIRDMYGS